MYLLLRKRLRLQQSCIFPEITFVRAAGQGAEPSGRMWRSIDAQ